jgi:hypothetical protein
MRPVSDPVENPEAVSSKQSGTNDRSTANTDSTLSKGAPEPTIEQTALPQKQHTYIIAGTVQHQMTGDTTPVALCVDESVPISRHSGEQVSIEMIQELREGAMIYAAGKKNKYGVIRATRVVF